jgi:hypothetical protein
MEDLADTEQPPIELPSYKMVAGRLDNAPPLDSVARDLDYASPQDEGPGPTPLPETNQEQPPIELPFYKMVAGGLDNAPP